MRLCPSCRGETTLRSSHHCNWRRLTWAIFATSVLVYVRWPGVKSGRTFRVLNMTPEFRLRESTAPKIVLDLWKESSGVFTERLTAPDELNNFNARFRGNGRLFPIALANNRFVQLNG